MILAARGPEVVIQLMIMLVFGAVCAGIASTRGRSVAAWFFVGLLAPCLGIILVLALPNLKLEQEKAEAQRRENRRLRERLRKERIVADQRHRATQERLGVHDKALGVDTSQANNTNLPPGPPPPPPSEQLDDGTQWYYLIGKERAGPFSLDQMRGLWSDRRIGSDTLVWSESMEDWAPLSSVEQLWDTLQ